MIDLDAIIAAFRNGEFFLEYLPTVRLQDNRCVGCEALIRWRRGNRVIAPMEFIPIAENTPMAGPLTYWVVDTVAAELGLWLRDQHDIHVSINVPPEVLGRGGVAYTVFKSNLLPVSDKLVLEITERGMPDRLGVEAINRRDNLDIRIALDDVGPSVNNLLVLSHVSVDIVKIDKSFTDQMLRADWSPEKISALSTFVRAARHDVIVEGVESATQVEILRDAGVEMAQGWYFSRPLAADDFKNYFAAHQ